MGKKKQRAPRSDSKLLQACLDGDLAKVRERIAAGANINAGRKDKRPPLETAARCGHLEVVRELISAGADVNQIAKVNFEVFPGSALTGAIKQKHLDVAQELVRAGASVSLETHPGCNAASEAAFRAIEFRWRSSQPDKVLLGGNATPVLRERQAQTFEGWFEFLKQSVNAGAKVYDYCLWEACKLGCTQVALYLISSGVNVNVMPHGTSALQKAIEGGFEEIALALIAAHADPNLTGHFGSPPLLSAVEKEKISIVKTLLDSGANVNTKGLVQLGKQEGHEDFTKNLDMSNLPPLISLLKHADIAEDCTPLIVAVRKGHLEIVELLVEHGADVNLADRVGMTPLSWAEGLKRDDIAAILNGKAARPSQYPEGSGVAAMISAAKAGNASRIENLIADGIDPNERFKTLIGFQRPLAEAARAGHLSAVECLLRVGAVPDGVVSEEGVFDITPLMLAAKLGYQAILRTLLAAGADIKAKDKLLGGGGGETALHYGAVGGNPEVMQALVEAGANVNAESSSGYTPLLLAIEKNKPQAVEALLKLGANPEVGPRHGSLPVQLATELGYKAILNILIRHDASLQKESSIPPRPGSLSSEG